MLIDPHSGYWTTQALAQYNIWRELDDLDLRLRALVILEDMLAKLRAGRGDVPKHIERKIREVDDRLRLRWEFDPPEPSTEGAGMWAVDIVIDDPNGRLGWPNHVYHTIFYWSHRLGDGSGLAQILRESDMTQPGYHKHKGLLAELQRSRLAKQRTDAVLAATDQLTRSQARQFIDVENALHTGEKVHWRGQDADILNGDRSVTS